MRARTKIYDSVTGEGRRRKLRSLLVGLLLLSFILAVSLWMIIEIMNQANILIGFPWEGIRSGEILHLLILFVLSFSSSTLYIVYYRGIREISKSAPRYLLAIAVLVLTARLLFRF
jgi:uncharacterized BrkB/YihY/UPF0761 family membrane protein